MQWKQRYSRCVHTFPNDIPVAGGEDGENVRRDSLVTSVRVYTAAAAASRLWLTATARDLRVPWLSA